jgi:hypothetical protein
MKFYIQMGHAMQSICKELAEYWGDATVILSPLNMPLPDKVKSFSKALKTVGGRVLFDPQMYSPRKYHKNLQKYEYFPKESITSIELGNCHSVISALAKMNDEIDSEAFILPSQTIGRIDERWSKVQNAISRQGRHAANGRKVLHTISLTSDVVMDEIQIESIIQSVAQWDIDGVYIVCEHPERYYLVDRPLWVANLLTLVAGIKRQGKEVTVGYASHQLLCLALAKCDAIASGNFLNVRWFQPEHFETTDNNEPGRRATWYYCPQVFSEYKVAYLDVAKRANLLPIMAPPPNMENKYSEVLFKGALPSATHYKESDSFKHYLHCLRIQCINSTKASYEETRDSLTVSFETASSIFTGLRNEKIKGQNRDFYEIIDATEAATSIFDNEFGFTLSQEWNTLQNR